MVSPFWKTAWQFLKVWKHKFNVCPSNSTSKGIENIYPHKNLYVDVIAAWLIIPRSWEQSKCLSVDEQINKIRCVCVCLLVAQSCPTLCDPMNCSSPGTSVHGILQARTLELVAIPFSRGSSQPRDRTQVSCIAGRFFTVLATREALYICVYIHPYNGILLSHKKE